MKILDVQKGSQLLCFSNLILMYFKFICLVFFLAGKDQSNFSLKTSFYGARKHHAILQRMETTNSLTQL